MKTKTTKWVSILDGRIGPESFHGNSYAFKGKTLLSRKKQSYNKNTYLKRKLKQTLETIDVRLNKNAVIEQFRIELYKDAVKKIDKEIDLIVKTVNDKKTAEKL